MAMSDSERDRIKINGWREGKKGEDSVVKVDAKGGEATFWTVEWLPFISDACASFSTYQAAYSIRSALINSFQYGQEAFVQSFYAMFPPPQQPQQQRERSSKHD